MSKNIFAALYLKAREKERRIYNDDEVSMLPFVKRDHVHFAEWEVRKKSFKKLRTYLQNKNKSLHVLDIGCGNGWMTNLLSEINNSMVTGIDQNDLEIEQAKRVFKDNNQIRFFCEDVLQTQHVGIGSVDVIVIAASVQYFPDVKILIERLFTMLKRHGEIHLLDSQFYSDANIMKAKKSTVLYYKNLGYPEMADYYFHHRWSDIDGFNFKIMNRSFMQRVLQKTFKTSRNYFPWIIIKKG